MLQYKCINYYVAIHIFLKNGLLGRIFRNTIQRQNTHKVLFNTHSKFIVYIILAQMWPQIVHGPDKLQASYSPAWYEISWTWDFKQSIISIIIDTGVMKENSYHTVKSYSITI